MLVLIRLGLHEDCSVLWGPLKLRLSALPMGGMSILSYTWGNGCAERVSASVGWAVPFTACATVMLHARLPALVNLMCVCQLQSIPTSKMRLRWMAENPAEMSLGKMTILNYVSSFVTAKIKITGRFFKEQAADKHLLTNEHQWELVTCYLYMHSRSKSKRNSLAKFNFQPLCYYRSFVMALCRNEKHRKGIAKKWKVTRDACF